MEPVKSPSVEVKEAPSRGPPRQDDGLAEALRSYVPGSDEEKKLVRKIDAYFLPMLWAMYILNYIDRTNIVSTVPRGDASTALTLRRETPRLPACLKIWA